jgi:tetratricopeptide (TPR) repeat protein
MEKIRVISTAAVLASLALQASAWTIFGSKEDALADKLRAGDKLMLRADEAYKDGKPSRAGAYYDRALRKYEALMKSDPGYMGGIAAIRIAYCAKQYTNALEAVAAAKAAGAAGEAEVSKHQAAQPPQPQAAQPPQPPAAEAAQLPRGEAAAQAVPPPKPPYDPRNFAHDFAEARMLMEDGNLSEAAAVLIPMLRHDPANRQVRLLLAIVRTRQSRYDEAIVALEDLRGIREDMPILLALSGAYMGAVRYHDALLTLDRAVRLNPADPNPYLNLAWLTLVMPQEADTLKNAEIYYRQAVRRGAARDRALETRIGLTKW